MKVRLIKTLNNFLKPVSSEDLEYIKKLKHNQEVEIEIKKVRNSAFHRKFFALMKLAFDNQDIYSSYETMRKKVTINSGFYTEEVCYKTGLITKEAKSISFVKMDEIEFEQLYNAVKYEIIDWLKIDNQDIEDNIEQYF